MKLTKLAGRRRQVLEAHEDEENRPSLLLSEIPKRGYKTKPAEFKKKGHAARVTCLLK